MPYPYASFAATRDMMRTGTCTAFVATGKTSREGAVLMGQTKDTQAPLERFRIQRFKYANGRRAVLLNYPGWIANLCLTSDGVSFTGTSLFASAPDGRTVPGSLLKRIICEKPSTSAILDEIRGMPLENGCLMVADRTGHAVCIEMAAGCVEVRDVSGKAFGHANDVLFESLKKFENANAWATSPLQQKRIDELLRAKSGEISADYLQERTTPPSRYPSAVITTSGMP